MAQIQKYSSLTEDQKYFIIDNLARSTPVDQVQDKFNKFFIGKSISGELVFQVALTHKTDLEKLKEQYNINFSDIPIANVRNELKMLEEIYDLAKTPRVISVDRNGDPVEKMDLSTALKCVEVANKIISQERMFKLKELEMNRYIMKDATDSVDEDGPVLDNRPKYNINIIHKLENNE